MYTSALLLASLCCISSVLAQRLPVVDLGYEVHQAISFNSTGQTYNFSNIRYAQPPVGDLRFAEPVPPSGRNPDVQNGSVGRICPQAAPAWTFIASEFSTSYIEGNYTSFNFNAAEAQLEALLASGQSSPVDPRTTEDCLFLDVIVPKAVFDNANNKHRKRSGGGAAVLLWIYGGGYTEGSKDGSGNPSGLIKASQASGGPGIIFVEINYRLGALGWLAGPTLEAAGGVANAGLYDQRLAIEWVKCNIHLFGGDPNQITLIGESAGGGSIMHQITAFGGQRGVSFQQAIPQSPGWLPIPSNFAQENITQTFLAILNVSTIAEARAAPAAAVIAANALQVGLSNYGSFTYGPVVDGIFAPLTPGLALLTGAYAKSIAIMAGHNVHEGVLFTDPRLQTDAEVAAYLTLSYPGIQPAVIAYILTVLYPAIYDGTYPWTNPIERTIQLVSESIFTCNTNYLARAFPTSSHNYEFEVFPSLHGFDIEYTFYNGQGSSAAAFLAAPVAQVLQRYITNFAQTGDPNGKQDGSVPFWPAYGAVPGLAQQALNVSYIGPQADPTANPRCYWWQEALYY